MKKQPTPMAQLTEQALDAMLQSANIPAPYDGLIPKISPWRQSMKLLVWGMMFTSIKLEFWNLHYILPALGAILFLLALLPLRRESGWFRLAFWGSIGQFLHTAITLFLQGTIWHNRFMDTALGTVLNVSVWFFFFAIYFAPLLGLAHLSRKSGCPPPNKRLVGFMLLSMGAYFYMGLAAALPSFLPLLAFAVYFYLLLRLLRQAFREMDQVDYLIQSRPAKLSARPLGILLASFLIICTAVGMTVGQSYPMDWQPVDLRQEHQGQEDLMAELISKGMPEHILMDLTAEDVASLAGATEFLVLEDPDSHFAQGQHTPNGARLLVTYLHIGFETADGVFRWKWLYHFRWEGDPGLRKTAYFKGSSTHSVSPNVLSTGRILYEDAGITYAGNYFGNDHTSTDSGYAATFSPPQNGLAHRGYLFFEDTCDNRIYAINGIATLIYQDNTPRYPCVTAAEISRQSFLFGNPEGFYRFQSGFFGKHTPWF